MRLIESASVSILHSAASLSWWAWVLIAWVSLDALFVFLVWNASRVRAERQQVVLDVFDGRRFAEDRASTIADYRSAKARRDTRAQNAAAARARIATIIELKATVRGGR